MSASGGPDVIVLGVGMVGLSTAMLLAAEGLQVTVLERDPQPAPDSADEVWNAWERRGVTQFHQGHYFQPRLTNELQHELPRLVDEIERFGALRYNPVIHTAPLTGLVPEPDDARFETLTARRPIMEAAFAHTASETAGIEIRRGIAIDGLLNGRVSASGVSHVHGVHTESGDEIAADLVIDATGRRSALPRWLDAIGSRPAHEVSEDFGFTYYGRHFHAKELPEAKTSLFSAYGSISILTLPADNDTWVVGYVCLSGDAPLRALLDKDTWQRAIEAFPAISHWAAAEPLEDHVISMSKMEDRIRDVVIDGEPIVTGLLPVGDAWACSNPSLGRGATIGFLHAMALRDAIRAEGLDDPAALAVAFDEHTRANVRPWYDSSLEIDRGRKVEIDADINGDEWVPAGPADEIAKAFGYGARVDPLLSRALTDLAGMIKPADEVFAQPGVLERAIEVGAGWRDEPRNGPTRTELLELLAR